MSEERNGAAPPFPGLASIPSTGNRTSLQHDMGDFAHHFVETVADKLVGTVVARLEAWLGLDGGGSECVSELSMARARQALRAAGEPVPRLLTKVELARALNTTPAQIDRLRRQYPDFPCEPVGAQSPRFDLQACRAFLRNRASASPPSGGSAISGVERLRRRA